MELARIIAVRNNKTVYRDGDNCIKVFDSDFTKADVLNEALNQARVEETGLMVPEIREVTKVNGKWAIVSEYIRGKTLDRLMQEHPEQNADYLERFVRLQTEVHAKTCPKLRKLNDKLNRRICMADLDATTRYDLHTHLDDMPKHHKLCHGDFTPANIILTDDGTPYILDWSRATQGNASADAAHTYLTFRLNRNPSMAEQYLALFCQISGIIRPYVEEWIPIVAASLSVEGSESERRFLLSVADGSAAANAVPEER